MIREIAEVGFEAGLLREGDKPWNLGGKEMGGRDEVAGACWEIVSSFRSGFSGSVLIEAIRRNSGVGSG